MVAALKISQAMVNIEFTLNVMSKETGKIWFWLSIVIIILDQLTKFLADSSLQYNVPNAVFPGLNMTLVYNYGAAFSFLSDAGGWQRWFFIILSSVVSILIAVWLYRTPANRRWTACTLALILGGAIGNLWDRINLGYVIDFIDVYYQQWHWPAFNIADSAISIGVAMLIVDALWLDRAVISTRDIQKPGSR